MSIRILVVDDHEDWRRLVRRLLEVRPELQVIGEASDGLECVQEAKELKPDLILLDIGLPKLNGIEAARRIRQFSPSSKIVFLSQNNHADIVRPALSTGAQGYLLKTNVVSELLSAVDAVLRGEKFVSSSLEGYEFTDRSGGKAPHCHEVLFYSDDTVLLESVTRFIADALKAGSAAIVLATRAHRESLLQRLKAAGVDTDGALHQGAYVSLDAADTLLTIMVNDLPDPARFFASIGGLIAAAARAAKSEEPRVVMFGEAVALLQAEGNADAAIRLEQLGNNLAKTYKVDILCAYPLSSFQSNESKHAFQSVCAEHSAVYSG